MPLYVASCETANAAPCWVGRPLEASAPEVGRSLAMMISWAVVAAAVAVVAAGAVVAAPVPPPPHADAIIATAMRTEAMESQRFCIGPPSPFGYWVRRSPASPSADLTGPRRVSVRAPPRLVNEMTVRLLRAADLALVCPMEEAI